jgi:predicted ribosome quality control (RQC) complex YloA/Tae2 family protein
MSQKYKTITLKSGNKIFLGKDESTNDLLMKEFQNKPNPILHTIKPGSPFCILESLEYSKQDLKEAAIICAAKSQDWRDNKKTIKLHQFTGQQASKPKGSKTGSWSLKAKPKVIKARKRDINKWLSDISS